ncbi:hypothetical protein [Corynebacterium sp. HMSC072A04]|uniref:hypothetical protein n=1 Tax=Corynebacterium sp. HMSC072A04 TaxID=1715045 RepID=UPI0008B0E647|nr:hypothetical protein [Corynebacterium sp. HMSC072A04]OFN33593.1 hypothetical protein HMPREF2565_11690 [Corynebacterium sp. HMSC072A04]
MTTAAQARYIESLRDNRDALTIDDDHIQDNIGLINQRLVRFGKTVDQEALNDWMEELITTHNHELECALDELTTAQASDLIESLKDGYHPALIANLDEVAIHFMPYIIKQLEAYIAERVEDVEAQIQRAEQVADGADVAHGPILDDMVEDAVAIYDTIQIQQAFGVQGDCETTIINEQAMGRMEARLKEAEERLSNRTGTRVAADVVRRASMNLLAGDAERDLMRRYIISSTNAMAAMAKKGA